MAGIHAPTLLSYSQKKERTEEQGGLDFRNVVEMEVQYAITRNQLVNRTHLRGLIGKWVSLNDIVTDSGGNLFLNCGIY